MANFLENRDRQQSDWEKYSNTPENTPLKRIAIISIFCASILMVAALLLLIISESESNERIYLVMRAGAGICATVGIISTMVLAYRIYSTSLRNRWPSNKKNTKLTGRERAVSRK